MKRLLHMTAGAGEPMVAGRLRRRLLRLATYASVSTAAILVVIKAWAWQATDSVSLLSSLVDSTLDVLGSLITFFAVTVSLKPADKEHRFGHGKAEGLAALAQSLIIAASAVFVLKESVERILAPAAVENAQTGIAVMGVSVAMTLLLLGIQRYVRLVTGSAAIEADAMHYRTDLVINLGVAAAIAVAAWPGGWLADPLVAAAVIAYLLFGVWKIAKHALDILMDREIPDKDRETIIRLAESHPAVHDIHDLKTRHGGSNYIVQFHVLLDAGLNLAEAHEILDDVETRIRTEFPGCELLLHPDPEGYNAGPREFGKA
ncbi:MAG: cation diffusion facilitator family transporter [Gammaproteobacteria bacterium]|nr:cation diffusion facilitator family transporter [Gammaproteobacteria bacterium]